MKISKASKFVVLFATASLTVTSAFAFGTYLRKGNQQIRVQQKGGKLSCKRKSDGFELCNGMTKQGKVWKGKKMKHPDMPRFMTFNGTVTFKKNSLSIKGCAIGNSMCDSEVWKKK